MPSSPKPVRSHALRDSLLALMLLVAFSAPAFLQLRQRWHEAPSDFSAALFPLCLHLGLTLLLLALAGRTRRALWILAPAAFLALPEALYEIWFRLPSGPHVYGVIADTDAAETLSWIGPWLWPALLLAALWLALVVWAGLCWWRADWRWRHRSRAWILIAAGATFAGFAALQWALADGLAKLAETAPNPYLEYSIEAPEIGFLVTLDASFPWGLPLRWQKFEEHQRALQSHQAAAARFNFGVQWRPGLPIAKAREIHVLVIGETGRADRWQLFGARRETTPHLAARKDLLPFTDAVSAASATRESVPLMLTRRPSADMLAPTDEPSLVTAYRQAGFKTYWLSTQGAAGRHETPISVLAREADEQHFINAADYRSAGSLDGELLPLLQGILARAEPRQLIVLHTLGSHLNYAARYPATFEKFKPALQRDEQADIWKPTHVPELRNAYDNSVLYTDQVLDQAIEMLANTGAAATLLYAADHGETLFDGSCARGGHGFEAESNYRIPMFVWASPQWQQARPQAWAALQAHQSASVSTLSIFATMNGLAGFDVAQPSAHGDLAEPRWQPAPRELTHFGNFDRRLKGRTCSTN